MGTGEEVGTELRVYNNTTISVLCVTGARKTVYIQ